MTNATRSSPSLLSLALAVFCAVRPAWPARPARADDDAIAHVLNRVAFGPSPGDLEHVRAIGVSRYIDEQLHPERLADAGMEARLAGLQTLRMTSREIAEQFEIPQLKARLARNGGRGEPGQRRTQPADRPAPEEQRRANQVVIELSEQKLLRAAYSERQLQEVLVDFWFNHFNVDARKGADEFLLTEYERETIRPHVLGKFRDLLERDREEPGDALLPRQLDERRSQRPARGRARTARLDVDRFGQRALRRPLSADATQLGRGQKQERAEGPQRELRTRADGAAHARRGRRLHAEGRDRGRARVHRLDDSERRDSAAATVSMPRLHDPGQKIVLGHVIKAGGGESDGEQVLDILARHPATARFIATALVRRFVSDTPPPALVDRAAARFRQTDGDLREVMRTILTSPEFLSPDAYGAKVEDAARVRRQRHQGDGRRQVDECACRSSARCASSACRSTSASRPPDTRTRPTRG